MKFDVNAKISRHYWYKCKEMKRHRVLETKNDVFLHNILTLALDHRHLYDS
jgi:hypothetical protein